MIDTLNALQTTNDAPLAEVLVELAAQGRTGVLTISHHDQTTKIALERGSVGAVISPFLRPWSADLVPQHVRADDYEQVRVASRLVADMFARLEMNGLIRADAIESVLRRRVIAALLPIMNRGASDMQFEERSLGQAFIHPGTRVFSFIAELRRRYLVLRSGNMLFTPDSTVIVPPLESELDLEGYSPNPLELEVLASFANGLTPIETAARTGLVWDELADIVVRLANAGTVRLSNLPRPTPTKRIRKRLIPGDVAPNFALPDVNGQIVSLEHFRGRGVFLRFNRQAGCAFCNPRNRDLIRLYPHFEQAGVEVVGIFGSPVEGLRAGIGKQDPPYPILADPKDTVYALYGVERSVWGILNPKNLPVAREGARMDTFVAKGEGEITRMPAELLIGPDGKVLRAHYQAFAADFLPLDTLLSDWLGVGPVVLGDADDLFFD